MIECDVTISLRFLFYVVEHTFSQFPKTATFSCEITDNILFLSVCNTYNKFYFEWLFLNDTKRSSSANCSQPPFFG